MPKDAVVASLLASFGVILLLARQLRIWSLRKGGKRLGSEEWWLGFWALVLVAGAVAAFI
jgi:hypothetical protein